MSCGTALDDKCTPDPRRLPLAVVLVCIALDVAAQDDEGDSEGVTSLPTLTITSAVPDRLEAVPGSTNLIERAQIEAERPFSIRELLQGVPGVHVVGEDAFGLNLNIGVRGLDPRRTVRTLLLEDGMPIQLAPYSDPSAHYSTPLTRIERIEVMKGSGQIVHGPQTVGGVINFVTRPVPREFVGEADLSIGNNRFNQISAGVGSGGDWGGWLVEALQRQGDGVRESHRHRLRDFSLKAALEISSRQSVLAKVGYYEEDSKIGEAGLDQARFDRDPFANPFPDDKFELERWAAQLVHRIELRENAQLSTQIYYQKVDRASYRQLDAIAEAGENETLRSRAPDTGPRNPACRLDGEGIDFTVPNGFEIFAPFCGNQMRPREYEFYGIEPRLEMVHQAFGIPGELVAGLRLHEERISRKRFSGTTPRSREESEGTYFRDQNDIDTDAFSAYLQNTTFLGDWSITPGLRLEDYSLKNTAVLSRTDREINNGKSVTIDNTEWLPGLGVTYFGLPQTTLFAGIHRGIAPPRPDANLNPTDDALQRVDPELSTNYEIGARSSALTGLQWEATLFQTDFDNQIVEGEALGLAQTYANAGETLFQGLEVAARVDFGQLRSGIHNPYATLSYTNLFTAKFENDAAGARGNRLPYAPRQMLSVGLGFEHAAGWDARMGVTYIDEQYTDAANSRAASADGQSGLIPSYTTLDAAVNFRLPQHGATLYLSATNLTDETYLVSRVNGAFAGASRQIIAGVSLMF
ncbi:TonB-dependent receptor family protein [Thiocapsa rosea]|uniref:Fe(3+) dicitrate transport protein n=1 Tax=Thiocapsa rosea TaxID=69360 RepID=A0A495VCP0_9GAMM|nr:TonB-dependent receptor [Thiocapsa rosea]RKT47122.1 Fe(3+) dicitrate transport protein [Thiocapsa rosea]